ncbi:hypothetical protein EBU71_08895 [bacterium]|nr:hypothetical protein [Candidatus Elulimicrobium humile]
MKTTHGFPYRAHDLKGLFRGTNKLSTFMTKLEKQSTLDPLRYDPQKYKGDGFEFWVEILLNSHAYDNRLGITNYQPVQSGDNGVDGVGINLTGEKCVVQVKYRSNKNSVLSSNQDKLSNMISDGMFSHGVHLTPENASLISQNKLAPIYYVITTANGLHHYTDSENFKGQVHCIGYDQLRTLVDGNLSFWNLCRKISDEITSSLVKS